MKHRTSQNYSRLTSVALSTAFLFGAVVQSSAATYTWTSTSGSSWQTAVNWSSAPTFNNQADLVFTSNMPLDAGLYRTYLGDANRTVRNITYSGTVAALIATRQFASGTSVSRNLTFDTDAVGGSATITTTAASANGLTLAGDGSLVLTDPLVVDVQGAGVTINAPMSGAGSLTKSGSGTLLFLGTSRQAAYSGSTFINAGTLQLGSSNTAGGLTSTAGITGNSGAVLLISRSDNVSQATTGAVTTNILNNKPITGGVGLTKASSGTTTLTLVNTYSGDTLITGGRLTLGASASIANSAKITVDSGAEFNVSGVTGGYTLGASQTLAGSGTVIGSSVIAGTLSPGNSPGTLTTGDMVWTNGGDYNWQVLDVDGAAGTGYDTISAGALDLSGLTAGGFSINLWSLSSIGPDVNGSALNFNDLSSYSWTLASTTGITGFNAANFTVNTSAANGTSGFANTFTGAFAVSTVGNNLVLTYTPVPEPAAALLGGLGSLLLLRRRRI